MHAPPRTKKNGTTNGQHRESVKRFARAVKESVAEKPEHERALPEATYNLRAVFYVDTLGERADLIGLLQAIADALEAAGVVTNDNQFKRLDGSKIETGDARPRCEVTITPLFT